MKKLPLSKYKATVPHPGDRDKRFNGTGAFCLGGLTKSTREANLAFPFLHKKKTRRGAGQSLIQAEGTQVMYDKTALDTSPSVNPFFEAALQYAGRRWPVMPLHSPGGTGKDGCSCNRADCPAPAKHPRIKGGKNWANASTDPKQIKEWWRRWPDANVAVVTGQRSGLVVIDIDGPAGFAQYQQLGALYGTLPNTAFVTTGRGAHIYLQCKIVCAGSVVGDGVDVRGEGNYVVAPPSIHASGRVYQWGKSYAR